MSVASVASQDYSRIALAVLGAFAVASLVFIAATVAFLTPQSKAEAGLVVEIGDIAGLPMREPVYFAEGNFYVVRLAESSVVALSAVDGHSRHCTIAWIPTFVFQGSTGWFRDPCGGSTYDLAGNRVYGPSPSDMASYKVVVGEGLPATTGNVRVYPNEQHLTPGPRWISTSATPVRK